MARRTSGGAITLLGASALLTFSLAAQAQNGFTPRNQASNINRPAAKNFAADLAPIADALTKKYDARIVIDPNLFVPTPLKALDPSLDLERSMDALAAHIKGSAWRRIYLPEAQSNGMPAPLKLANAARALDQIEHLGLVIENPATKRATSLMKNYPVAPTFATDLKDMQFSPKPFYLLYSTLSGDARSPMERYADLQKQQMEMMLNMSPDQMSQAMALGMQMFQNMDPNTRTQMMGNMMRAGMQMFQNMSESDKASLMQSVGQAFQGGIPGGAGSGR